MQKKTHYLKGAV